MIEKKKTVNVLKTMSVLASVRVVTIISSLIKNKVISIFLGTEGVGLFGVLQNFQSLSSAFFGFGVSKSSVRDISFSKSSNNSNVEVSKMAKTAFYLTLLLSLVGNVIIILFSNELSELTFDSNKYSIYIKVMSLSIFFNILFNGQQAIIQGLREVKILAKSAALSAFIGVLISVPLYFFFKLDGVIYAFICSSLISFLVSKRYSKKLNLTEVNLKLSEFVVNSKNMLVLGGSLMIVSVMVSLYGFVLKSYLVKVGGLEVVGVYQSGYQILGGYFGLIFTSIALDYFPRISEVANDNIKINQEVDIQSKASLVLIAPLVVVIVFASDWIVQFLYSKEFLKTSSYLLYGSFGITFLPLGQILGMVFLAKNNTRIYLIMVFALQILFFVNSIVLYQYYDVKGLGMAFSLNMFLNMLFPWLINKKIYNIKLSKDLKRIMFQVLLFTTCSVLIVNFVEETLLKYVIGGVVFFTSLFYTIQEMKRSLDLSLLSFFKKK